MKNQNFNDVSKFIPSEADGSHDNFKNGGVEVLSFGLYDGLPGVGRYRFNPETWASAQEIDGENALIYLDYDNPDFFVFEPDNE